MRRFAISTLFAVLAVLALAAGPANAALNVGLEDENVFVSGNSTVSALDGYQMLDDLGVKSMRVLVTQTSVQSGNNYDFVAYQNMLQSARSNGISVQVVLVGKYPTPNIPSFTKFATAAATAFKGQVSFYSIWNEPNLNAWIRGSNKGAIYRKIYTAGYKAIRKVDRSGKILIGETSPSGRGRSRGLDPLKFLRQVACVDANYRTLKGKRCPALTANGYAQHPYDLDHAPRQSNLGPDSVTIGTLPNLRHALAKLRGKIRGTSSIYLTEFGYALSGPHKLTPAKASAYTKQAYSIARRTPGVKSMVQYLLLNTNKGAAFPTGLLTTNGQPNALYAAFKSVS